MLILKSGHYQKMLNLIKGLTITSDHKSVDDDRIFFNIMEMANEIATVSPLGHGLSELIWALLRPLQAEHMITVAESRSYLAPLFYLDFFFPLNKIAHSEEFYLRDKPQIEIKLAKDIVLPTPWKRNRFADALATIGTDKSKGTWTPDYSNQAIKLILPWRIGFVTGGNHSITEGILMGEGHIFAHEVFDMSPLLQRVQCDGKTYREIGSGRILSEASDPRRAAVYEIGRLMLKSVTQT